MLLGKNESENLKIEEKLEWLEMITIKILRGGRKEGVEIKQITFQETNFSSLLELPGGLCKELFQWLP